METRNNKLRMLIYSAMFIAITGILAQVNIPLPLVPISGQTLAVGLTATILGSRYGAISMLGYLAVGAVGVPVFEGWSAGAYVLIGPTGGYIFGFIVSAFVTGLILEKTTYSIKMAMVANIVGMMVTLMMGMVQLKFVLNLSWTGAFMSGVAPFIVVGLIKAFIASYVGIKVRKRLVEADLIAHAASHKKAAI